ncbi:MAG: SLC13 family permease [Alphaproteobacteria bacterium]
MLAVDPSLQIWATLAFVLGAVAIYAWDKYPIELTAGGIIAALLIYFQFFPVLDASGQNVLSPGVILAGFANPALIAVLALLVVGQGLVRTGALDQTAEWALRLGGGNAFICFLLILIAVMALSAFLNNTPVVVIFIPIMQALAERFGQSASRFMIPLSYAAILGGMTTLIGSSTNLLVSDSLAAMGETPLGFFEFSIPGLMLGGAGLVFLIVIGVRLLPPRASLAGALVGESGKQFIAQITVTAHSDLIGEEAKAGIFPGLKDVTVRMIQRGEHAELPPFDGFRLREGDVIIVAATRKALLDVLSRDVGLLGPDLPEDEEGGLAGSDMILMEGMVTPASRLIGQNLEQSGFRYNYDCIVLGIQRRSRMIRARMTEIRLEAGDVLLILGHRGDIEALRASRDVVPMEWSATEIGAPEMARRASLIFLAVVGVAAAELMPIVVTATAGAVGMIAAGALNVRQAARAIDRKIMMLVASALALGVAMQETGTAAFLANILVAGFGDFGPEVMLSVFFLFVALMTNILSNNACAVLFTPIAISLAAGLDVDPRIFAIAVVLAANCSFATPIGYQTNLLVMGPGHYRFSDYARIGLPMTLLMWLVFTLFAPGYFGL